MFGGFGAHRGQAVLDMRWHHREFLPQHQAILLQPLQRLRQHLLADPTDLPPQPADVLLRNGWYAENYAAGIPGILEHGAMFGSAGDGRLSLAARADYAEAAAAVIASDEPQAGKIHELAGDDAITLADFAAELARQTGKPLAYQDLPQQDYRDALLAAGLPAGFAELLSDSDAGAAKDGLFDDSGTLGRLIGRATTPIADVIGKALAN